MLVRHERQSWRIPVPYKFSLLLLLLFFFFLPVPLFAAPGPVQSLEVNQDTTGSDIQLRITWSAPTENNCPVDDYIIQHGLTRVMACDADIESPRFEVQTTSITRMHLTNLLANSKYFVSVIARNTIGSSTYTPIFKSTSKKGGYIQLLVYPIEFSWNILIVVHGIVIPKVAA